MVRRPLASQSSPLSTPGQSCSAYRPAKAKTARTTHRIRPLVDDAYGDGAVANTAVERLQSLATAPDQPCFLAVGFFKPHLPFVAPQRYWDLYPPKSIKLPDNYKLPVNAPAESKHTWRELHRRPSR